ncbi:MAG: transglutaminase domain-containing protein [Lachnospiraceae bacterium]
MEPYYYQQMDKTSRAVYHAMKTGLTALAPAFSVPRMEGRELSDIFFKLRLDCPEIFYAVSFRFRYHPEGTTTEIIPEYMFEKGKIQEHKKAMESRIAKLAREAQSMTSWEKEQYIHDFICKNVRYDKLKKPYSHEIIGPLGQGVGVCEGIAKTVKILCDTLGIWCIIAVSDANPEKKIKYRHAWNVVKLDGTCYHLDATFDNSLGQDDEIRYDYLNLDDSRIFRDHEPALYPLPACGDGEHFYYRVKKLSFTKVEEVRKRAGQAAKKGKPFLFHWRGSYLTREMLQELLLQIQEAAREKGKFARVTLNWPQAVLRAVFQENVPETDLVWEEANEGEEIG